MENLVLPILMVVILTVAAVVDYVDGKPERKERVLKIVGKALALIVVTVAISILFGGVLYGAFAEEEISWQHAESNGSVECYFNGETVYLVVFTTEDGEVLSYFDDTEVVKGTRLRVKISPYGETLDAEVEESEHIWFPPFFLLSVAATPAAAAKTKKFKREQKMPPDFYLPCSLFDKNTYIVYFVEKKKYFVKLKLDEALKKLASAAEEKIPAFVCAFVETYKQQAIIACNYCGFLEYWRNTAISDKVNAANALLHRDIQIIPVGKPSVTRTPVISGLNIDDKNDPVRQLIKVKYSETSDEFTFRCRKAHTPGDFVCVYTKRRGEEKKTYKNVKVTKYFFLHESEIKDLANSLGYPDISEVYCDQAIELTEAWSNWRDPANDPELYAPTEEEIADFEAMREAYSPRGYRDF